MQIIRIYSLAVVAALFSSAIAAQVIPGLINYQGRLTDNSPGQAPLTANVSMQFEIWSLPAGGAPVPDRLWVEPSSGTLSVQVTGGIFSVQLGGNGVPVPAALFAGGTERYLQLIVNGEPLAPRQRISAAGYAHQAENASVAATATDATQLGGVAAGGYQLATTRTCDAGQFIASISAAGTAACATPPPNNLNPPLSLNGNSAAAVLTAINAGTGQAGDFEISDASNASPALLAYTPGGGAGVDGLNVGTGAAGRFRILNPSNAATALVASTTGTGSAADISVAGAANSSPALNVTHTGFGHAGQFTLNRTASTKHALDATSNGLTAALQSTATGTGGAAEFIVSNTGSGAWALNSITYGTGRAGNFIISNPSSAAAALQAQTNGTGPAGNFIGNVTISGKATSAATAGGDDATTLATKGYVDAAAAGAVPTPLSLAQSAGSSTISGTNNGSGYGLFGHSALGHGVFARGAGSDPLKAGLYATNTGSGSAAIFELATAGNAQPTVGARNTAVGNAGTFEVVNPASTAAALSGQTNGGGTAVLGLQNGTGRAGYFQILNAANTGAALGGTTNGTGAGVSGVNTNASGATYGVMGDVASPNGFGLYTPDRAYAAKGYTQPGGGETLRMLRGILTSAGGTTSGTGFLAARTALGTYTIGYGTAFAAPPAVLITPLGVTGVMAVVTGVSTSDITVRTFTPAGAPVDNGFMFLIAGPA